MQDLSLAEGQGLAAPLQGGLVPFSDDRHNVSRLGVVKGVVQRLPPVGNLHKGCVGIAPVQPGADIRQNILKRFPAAVIFGGLQYISTSNPANTTVAGTPISAHGVPTSSSPVQQLPPLHLWFLVRVYRENRKIAQTGILYPGEYLAEVECERGLTPGEKVTIQIRDLHGEALSLSE